MRCTFTRPSTTASTSVARVSHGAAGRDDAAIPIGSPLRAFACGPDGADADDGSCLAVGPFAAQTGQAVGVWRKLAIWS